MDISATSPIELFVSPIVIKGSGSVNGPSIFTTEFKIERTEVFAFDLHKLTLDKGEAINEDAINLSIENILSTIRGERIFVPFFGSVLPLVTFEQINEDSAEELLTFLLRAINKWEKRIIVLEDQVGLDVISSENSMTLTIPYIIKRNELVSTFRRKIIL